MDASTSTPSPRPLTQAEFFDWVEAHASELHGKVELIHGRIVMTPPAGLSHGSIGARLCARIGVHVERRRLGQVYDASTGFELPSGDTLEPDVSFVSNESLAAGPPTPLEKFGRVVPDLVVEVASASTARRDRTEKKAIYAANGVREYWIVDPKRRSITVFRLQGTTFDEGAVFAAGTATSAVLAGLEIDVDALFN